MSEDTGLPVAFGPGENVLWKTPVPVGNSSRVIARDTVYLTGFEKARLFTVRIPATPTRAARRTCRRSRRRSRGWT
jgi:hypothetical protein